MLLKPLGHIIEIEGYDPCTESGGYGSDVPIFKFWKDIKELEVYAGNDTPTLPFKLRLVRNDGSVVTSGGCNLAEAAVTLFSTAGLGRIPPKRIAILIAQNFGERMGHEPYQALAGLLGVPVNGAN